jgi:hypothetical protein
MRKGQIYETVVSTYDADCKPNAAPMGIVPLSKQSLLIRPFKTSSTYRNLLETRCGVINVTSVPEVFYRTTFKHEDRGRKALLGWFEPAKTIAAPRIKLAEGHIEFTVRNLQEKNEDRAQFICKARLIEAKRTFPQAYCRGAFASIECIIHATRIKEYLSNERDVEAEKLISLIDYYRELTDRVSPYSKNAQIIMLITSHVEKWKKKDASIHQNSG